MPGQGWCQAFCHWGSGVLGNLLVFRRFAYLFARRRIFAASAEDAFTEEFMKALALIECPNHVCYRYRIEAFAWALSQRGIMLDVASLEHGIVPRLRLLRAARDADVVILQRKLLPFWQLRMLRRLAPRLIYDVDDSLFQRDSYSQKGPESWGRLMSFWSTVYTRPTR